MRACYAGISGCDRNAARAPRLLRGLADAQVAFTGDHLAFRADRPMEAEPLTSPDDKLSVFECAPLHWQTLCTSALGYGLCGFFFFALRDDNA